VINNKKLLVKFFFASLLCFLVWDAPKIALVDLMLKKQNLAFSYEHISGSLAEITLHNVVPNKANAISLPSINVKPSYTSLFTGKFVADISANISQGNITGSVNKKLFSKGVSMDVAFENISISPQKSLLERTIFKTYLDSVNANLSGNLTGDISSSSWLDKKNNMQLTFTLSNTELALKNLGALQAGEVNGTLSMQEGALFADIHTLDDNKGFNFELDGRSSLAARLADSGIAGDVKISFLGGNETNQIIFGSLGKPRLRPAQ
jgi:hypothetical protein